MKILLTLLMLFLSVTVQAQIKPDQSYDGAYNGYAETAHSDLVSVQFTMQQSTYFIRYIAEYKGIVKFNRFYIGTFSINSNGMLHLNGEHPFTQSDFLITDTLVSPDQYELAHGYQLKRYIRFETRISDSLAVKKADQLMIQKIFLSRKTDQPQWDATGCCMYPLFYPRSSEIYTRGQKRDSLFRELSKTGSKCNRVELNIPEIMSKYNYSERTYFQVDSIRFDTLYVNQLYLQKQSSYYTVVDTFCLDRTARVRIKSGEVGFGLPEHTPVFQDSDSQSTLIYDRQETDLIDAFELLEHYKDPYGVEWVKIELVVRLYNEDAVESPDEQYIHKKVVGWTLQKYIFIGYS